MTSCACGVHVLQPGGYLVADGVEHRRHFCQPVVIPSWSPVLRYARAAKREHDRRNALPVTERAGDTLLTALCANAERARLRCPAAVVEATLPHTEVTP